MAEIILLSLASDERRVRPVAEALLKNGLEFWWEQLESGAHPSIAEARCIILAVTNGVLGDGSPLAGAIAAADGRIIVARLDGGQLPESLAGRTIVDLTRFKHAADDLFLLDLLNAAKAKAAGIDPPPPRGPIARFRTRALTIGSAAFVAVTTLIALRADIGVLVHEGIVPEINQPTAVEAAAWNGIPFGKPGSCEALRQIRGGYYAAQAQQLLIAARSVGVRSTAPVSEIELPLVTSIIQLPFSASETEARRAALAAGRIEAETNCRKSAASLHDEYVRFLLEPKPSEFACEHFRQGFKCVLSTSYRCTAWENRPVLICG